MRSTTTYLVTTVAIALLGCSAWIDTDKLGEAPSVGGNATCATGCDDGVDCTQDECVLGACTHSVNSTLCSAEQVCDVTRGCIPKGCSGDGCVCMGSDCPGPGPSCTVDQQDKDGDGHYAQVPDQPSCGDDCRDDDPGVYGGARELCNGQDDDCDGVADDACVNLPPLCETVQNLALTNGRAQVEGTLGELGTRPITSCGGGSGRGVVYSFDVPMLADIIIDTAGSSFPTLVAVGADCSSEGGFNLGCAAGQMRDSTRSRLVIHRFDPSVRRTLYVVVDSLGPRNNGAFKLSIQVIPAASYSCLGAPLNIAEGGTLVGFMAGGPGSLSPGCVLGGGVGIFNPPEAVVRYAATANTRLRCQVSSTAFAPSLYALNSCGGLFSSELDCAAAAGQAAKAEIDFSVMAGSEAFIVVDNGREGGKYELTCAPQ